MSSPLLVWNLRSDLLSAALAVGALAAFAALSLARGLATAEPATRWRRLLCASLALATGVLAVHFIVLSGDSHPGSPGYDGATLVFALALALGGALAAQWLLAGARSPGRVVAAALAFGVGLGAAPVAAMQALQISPAIDWNLVGLGSAVLLAALGAAAALSIGPGLRLTHAASDTAGRRPTAAALALGATLVGVDLAVIASARVPVGGTASAAGAIGSDGLTVLAMIGGPAVLALLLSSLLEDRFGRLLARARDELQRASHTDLLTGLPNRQLFEQRLQRAVHRADRTDRCLALLFVNLDGLKGVNAALGQSTGDALLRAMGQRLRALGGRECVARAGGDEFLILLDSNPDAAEVSRRAAQVLPEMARPCTLDQHPVVVSCSIGIAMYPEHGAFSRLIPHAAAALNAAKHLGGASYSFFEASMVTGKREEVELLRDLRSAIEQRELELFYQPKIHAPSGQITGVEALIRWHHPQRGLINPAQFIPLAEHYGLINALGQWVIEDACRQIRAWRDTGLRMRVAINLSVHQLRQSDLAADIGAALKRYHLEPRVLTCEITESVAMDDSQETFKVIEQLAAVDVHLSIDDFGTGYSNLSCLRKLPAEELKIDRGFVLDLETSGDARAIVDAVVKLAQAIGLKVVAEGVETEQQQILRQLGCDELQGYLFARPMSATALARWAMNHEGPRALDFRASLFGETRTVELA
jgi:diguanylate cyclase (GGDEF)-like protein